MHRTWGPAEVSPQARGGRTACTLFQPLDDDLGDSAQPIVSASGSFSLSRVKLTLPRCETPTE